MDRPDNHTDNHNHRKGLKLTQTADKSLKQPQNHRSVTKQARKSLKGQKTPKQPKNHRTPRENHSNTQEITKNPRKHLKLPEQHLTQPEKHQNTEKIPNTSRKTAKRLENTQHGLSKSLTTARPEIPRTARKQLNQPRDVQERALNKRHQPKRVLGVLVLGYQGY